MAATFLRSCFHASLESKVRANFSVYHGATVTKIMFNPGTRRFKTVHQNRTLVFLTTIWSWKSLKTKE